MIDVRLRIFIPSRAVAIPLGPFTSGFGGDNRSFSFDQGTSRADIWVDVDNSPHTNNPLAVKRLSFGETTRYSVDKIQGVIGKPFWWQEIKRDQLLQIEASPDAIATAEVMESTLNVHGSLEPDPFGLIPNIRIKFHVVGTNPLEPLAFPINCDLDVLVSATGSQLLSFSVNGAHDGFPAYELYIKERRVYSFDPVAAGTNPFNLAAQGDVTVNMPVTALV
jgi:hypothetical protein